MSTYRVTPWHGREVFQASPPRHDRECREAEETADELLAAYEGWRGLHIHNGLLYGLNDQRHPLKWIHQDLDMDLRDDGHGVAMPRTWVEQKVSAWKAGLPTECVL